ncbi:MAG: hypothetical protein WC360_03345 [Opitutales bacterium]
MKPRTFRLTVIAAAVALLPSLCGAQVVADKARQSRLESLARVLDAPAKDYEAMLKDCRDPFYPSDAGLYKPADKLKGLNAAPAAVDYGKVLAVAASSLRATGIMSRAGRQMLVGADGEITGVGTYLDVPMDSVVYRVLIQAADQNAYTLSIESESLVTPYADRPSSAAPSPALK